MTLHTRSRFFAEMTLSHTLSNIKVAAIIIAVVILLTPHNGRLSHF